MNILNIILFLIQLGININLKQLNNYLITSEKRLGSSKVCLDDLVCFGKQNELIPEDENKVYPLFI